MKPTSWLIVLILVIVAAAAGWGWYSGWIPNALGLGKGKGGGETETENGIDQNRPVHSLGRLEPAGGVLTIGAMVGERLDDLYVAEGDTVEAGTSLAKLSSLPLRELELAALKSQRREAEARQKAEMQIAASRTAAAELAERQANAPRVELEAQAKKIELLEANVTLEERQVAKLDDLPTELVSSSQKSRQDLLLQKARTELQAAEAELVRMEQAAEFQQQSAKMEREAAETAEQQVAETAALEVLDSRIALAEAQRDRAQLKAPIEGTILKVFTRAGEFVAQGPVVQMADLRQMVCIAEVYDAEIGRISQGQVAEVTSPALGREVKLVGRVERIGRMIASPRLSAIDPYARADLHVIEVRIVFDEENSKQAARFVNLQVEVAFPKASAPSGESS